MENSAQRNIPSLTLLMRLFKWGLWLFLGLIFISLGEFFGSLFLPKLVGSLAINSTKYLDAELIYHGTRIVGSSEWQDETYIYWTDDSLDSVRSHYEKHFPPFRLDEAVQEGYPIVYRTTSTTLSIGFYITLLDADQDNRSWLLLDSYRKNPSDILKNAPRTGTLIILTHDIYAP